MELENGIRIADFHSDGVRAYRICAAFISGSSVASREPSLKCQLRLTDWRTGRPLGLLAGKQVVLSSADQR